MKNSILFISVLFCICSCSCPRSHQTRSGLDSEKFRSFTENGETALYTLDNKHGMEVCLTNYGGRIVSVMVPDKDGISRDVVLGFDNIRDYMNIDNNFGATIGRYGNRINQGKFAIDGVEYQLPRNNFGHCLHGGPDGWDHRIMNVSELTDSSLVFQLVSPDGDAGFPGTVHASVRVTVTHDNAVKLEYNATTDRKTIINMTNHSYFNLSGNPEAGILDHQMYINADGFTPIDSTFMTSGEIRPVCGTPMDFRSPELIGNDIEANDRQLDNGRGYDHNWVLNTRGDLEEVAACLYCPASGIMLEVFTDEPGLQVYTGNFLDGTITGKNGKRYIHRASVCLETQHFPDSPNKPEWPSPIVDTDETYHSTCIYKFSVR